MRIDIERLSKRFGRFAALDGLSLAIEPGQVVAVLGANGAGKTTLLRCLAGVARPSSGEIRYDGETFARDRIDLRRRLVYLPDTPQVLPDMPLVRHVGLVLKLYGADGEGIEDRVVERLRDFDLLPLAALPFQMLSRGQAYKGALTAALAVDPELWLIDEPFASGMDPDGISRFKALARDAAKRGRTVVYTTQILDIAEVFSDRVIIIDRGRLHAYDRLENLRTGPGKEGVLEEIFRRLREARP